jgi:plastocyanin
MPGLTVRAWLRWLWLAAFLFLSDNIAAADAKDPAQGTVHTVVIENMQFNPAELQVHRGEKIVWVNKDLFPHTATAASHAFDSGSIAADSSWTYAAGKAGEYPYGCTFHPTMKGIIKVQ